MTQTLTALAREGKESPAEIRRSGRIPAVVYGPKQDSTPVSVDMRAFEKVLRDAGESSVVSLEGVSVSPLQVLIHEVEIDPVKRSPRHIDFYAIAKGAKVEVAVPIVFLGEAPAAKAGANIVKVMHELHIKADVAHLPHDVSVDISVLAAVGDKIHVSDIVLSEGVVLVTHPEEVVALVQEVVEEKEEVPAAVDMAAIEVEKKGKEEEAGETEPAKE